MKKKILVIVSGVVVFLIACYLVYAYLFHEKMKSRFADILGKDMSESGMFMENDGVYMEDDGEILYVCALLDWWKIGGNLQISSAYNYDENGELVNEYFMMTIPLVKSQDGYAVAIRLGYRGEDGKIHRVSYDLNERMEFVNPDDVSTVQEAMFEELKPRIRELYQRAYDKWGILNLDNIAP